MEVLLSGMTEDERHMVLGDLSPDVGEHADDQDVALSDETIEAWAATEEGQRYGRLGQIWEGEYKATPGPVVLRARRVDHPTAFLRFVGADFAPRRDSSTLWLVSGYISQLVSGAVVVDRLAIEPEHAGAAAITTDVLRAFRPGDIVAKARAFLSALPDAYEATGEDPTVADVEALRAAADVLPSPPVRGKRGYSDEFCREIAIACVDEYRLRRRGVIRRLQERYARSGEERRPHGTVKDWIAEATARGFLEERGRGNGVFEPGWRLRRLLQPGE